VGPGGSTHSTWASAHSEKRIGSARSAQTTSTGAATTAAGQTFRLKRIPQV